MNGSETNQDLLKPPIDYSGDEFRQMVSKSDADRLRDEAEKFEERKRAALMVEQKKRAEIIKAAEIRYVQPLIPKEQVRAGNNPMPVVERIKRTDRQLTLDEIVHNAVVEALERNEGNRTYAAAELGITRSRILRLLGTKYGDIHG